LRVARIDINNPVEGKFFTMKGRIGGLFFGCFLYYSCVSLPKKAADNAIIPCESVTAIAPLPPAKPLPAIRVAPGAILVSL
jgi:hypothetical protein